MNQETEAVLACSSVCGVLSFAYEWRSACFGRAAANAAEDMNVDGGVVVVVHFVCT